MYQSPISFLDFFFGGGGRRAGVRTLIFCFLFFCFTRSFSPFISFHHPITKGTIPFLPFYSPEGLCLKTASSCHIHTFQVLSHSQFSDLQGNIFSFFTIWQWFQTNVRVTASSLLSSEHFFSGCPWLARKFYGRALVLVFTINAFIIPILQLFYQHVCVCVVLFVLAILYFGGVTRGDIGLSIHPLSVAAQKLLA